MTAGAGLVPHTPEQYARWAMEQAVARGGMERAIADAVRMAIAEDRVTRPSAEREARRG